MFKIIRKADIVLIILIVVVGLILSFALTTSKISGEKITITIAGDLYGTYSLSEDRTIELSTGNIISINDKKVHMESATCDGQDCVRMGYVSMDGQSIICLPHKVVVKLEGGDSNYDTISK